MIDVTKNRQSKKYTKLEYFKRLAWDYCGAILFKALPSPCFWWYRNLVLKLFGASVGKRVRVSRSVQITCPYNLNLADDVAIDHEVSLYCLGQIEIGKRSVISQKSFLCAGTHDYRDAAMPLIKAPIKILQDSWVCASVFIGPGVVVNNDCVVAAGSVVVRDVATNTVVGGNPAVFKKFKSDLE